jgi:uroporphyrinogen-III synthase
LKVKSILVSQPRPEGERSPFFDLADKLNLKIDFRPFIQVDPIAVKELRKEKINELNYTAVIFNSRNAVDNFFRVANEVKTEMPADMKYFCVNEGMAYYLQKYIVLRKRKVFYGKGSTKDLLDLIKAHSGENYLYPCSDVRAPLVPDFLKKNKIKFRESVLYRTVASDLSDLTHVNYDIIVFFSPSDIKSLFENFPEFKQNNTRIAGFGAVTQKAIEDAGLTVNIPAPTPETPSMVMALEKYVVEVNK